MTHQINLYAPAYRPKALPFSANWTLAAVLVTAVATVGYSALANIRLAELKSRRGTNESQLKQVREQLAGLGQAALRTRSKALEEQVERAEALTGLQQELSVQLKSGEFGNREGYAEILTALARQRLEGVWLTRVEVAGIGGDFTIEGRALRAGLVPGYIRMLRNEEALRGRPIGTLALREREIELARAAPAPASGGAGDTAQDAAKGAAPAAPTAGASATPTARPTVKVVEFTLGASAGGVTGVTGTTVGTGVAANAVGRPGR